AAPPGAPAWARRNWLTLASSAPTRAASRRAASAAWSTPRRSLRAASAAASTSERLALALQACLAILREPAQLILQRDDPPGRAFVGGVRRSLRAQRGEPHLAA